MQFQATPSTLSRVFSKTEMFFSEYGYHAHVAGVFRHRKRRFSNTLSRVETFENGDLTYSSGRANTEVFNYDDIMPRFQARSSAQFRFERRIFISIRRKVSVFENTRQRVDGASEFVL